MVQGSLTRHSSTFSPPSALSEPAPALHLGVLRRHHRGRLGYVSGRGPRQLVVTYSVNDNGDIVIRVPHYSELAGYAEGERVSFEVRDRMDEQLWLAVVIHGRARVTPDRPATAGPPERWPAHVPTRLLLVPVDEVECLILPRTNR